MLLARFHSRNMEAGLQVKINCYGKRLEYTCKPVYLGVTLGWSLTQKDHNATIKAKVGSRKNVLKKVSNAKWDAHTSTIRISASALCYSTAKCTSRVWSRSSNAKKIDTALNASCRSIYCVSSQPKQIISTYLVSTPLRNQDRKLTVVIHSTNQNQRQTGSRHGFLDSVEPLNNIDPSQHLSLQCSHLKNVEHRLSFCYTEYLPAGSSDAWPFSSGLNHLRTAGDVPSMMIPTANAGKYKLFSIFQLVPILKIHRLLTPLKS